MHRLEDKNKGTQPIFKLVLNPHVQLLQPRPTCLHANYILNPSKPTSAYMHDTSNPGANPHMQDETMRCRPAVMDFDARVSTYPAGFASGTCAFDGTVVVLRTLEVTILYHQVICLWFCYGPPNLYEASCRHTLNSGAGLVSYKQTL
jgi:hypothetical protein